MVQRTAWDPPKVQIQVRFLVETLALQVYRIARQTTNLQDGVRFLGGALSENTSSECGGFARDPAKVEDQARLLARTLENVALEPDGTATACKAVWSGFDSHRRLFGSNDTARPTAYAALS